ncbi:MAG: hypothetical protein ACK4MS_05880 [Paracoccaceae bacterium]
MNPIWFLRMARWVRRPPSMARVKLVVGVVLACLAIFAIEYVWGWPDALTPQRIRP